MQKISKYLYEQCNELVAKYPKIFKEIRGKGLMLGFVCDITNIELWNKLRHAGLLTVPADENVIRILPPLVIETSHVDEAIEIIGNVAAKWEHGNADA